jgi:hypothetical protein
MVNGLGPDINSRVAAVQLRGDGTIVLAIELTSFRPGTPVEISGYVTQASGAFTRFYEIHHVPLASPDDPGRPAILHVEVPPMPLAEGEDIMVITRVAEVWSTVLTSDAPEPSIGTWAASLPEGTGAAWKFKSATRWGDDQLPPA